MPLLKRDIMRIRAETDVVLVRQAVRQLTTACGFGLVDQTKFVTAASEIARNTLQYGGGGEVQLERHQDGAKKGAKLIFEDKGPGIPDIEQALKDGFTTGGGLGHGLGGAKRLVEHFEITSTPGMGTRVMLARWV
jgi:serine/threonine-protein kinase RsbT